MAQSKTALCGKARAALVLINLFSFKAIATGAAFCIAAAGVANVDFSKRAIIARAIVLAVRNAATDTRVYFFFVHHNKKPPLRYE